MKKFTILLTILFIAFVSYIPISGKDDDYLSLNPDNSFEQSKETEIYDLYANEII